MIRNRVNTNCIGKVCINYIDEAVLRIVSIVSKFHFPQEEVPNCISSKSIHQILRFKCIPQ